MRNASLTAQKRVKTLGQAIRKLFAGRNNSSSVLPFHQEELESRMLLSTVILTSSDDTYVRPGSITGGQNFNEASGSCYLPLAGTSCLVVRNVNVSKTGTLT